MAERDRVFGLSLTDHESVVFLEALKPLLLGGLAQSVRLKAPEGHAIRARGIRRAVVFDNENLLTIDRIHDFPVPHDTTMTVEELEVFKADDYVRAQQYDIRHKDIGVLYFPRQIGRQVIHYASPLDITSFVALPAASIRTGHEELAPHFEAMRARLRGA